MRGSKRLLRPTVGLVFSISAVMTCVALSPGQSPGPTPSSPGTSTPITPTGCDDRRLTAPQETDGWSVSGKVVMEDGAPPPAPVSVEVVCKGVTCVSGSTSPTGGFSLSTPCTILPQRAGSGSVAHVSTLAGECLLRIRLVGYRSETKSLLFERRPPPGSNVPLDVGTTILHPLPGVEATATSVASLSAPKQAKAAFEKGMAAFEKHKPDEAAKHLERAVQIYPKYGAAWFELGQARERQGDCEGAVWAYYQSIFADSKFFKPYVPLTLLLVQVESWEGLAWVSAKAVRLDPVDFPWLWVANATANVHLSKASEAEEAARQAIKIDTWRERPDAEYILAALLANKGDLKAAKEHMRTYVELAPNGENAPLARQELARIERALASPAGAGNAAPK